MFIRKDFIYVILRIIVLHDLQIVISSQTFQEDEPNRNNSNRVHRLIKSSFLIVIRLKHFENWTKNAETFRMNHRLSHDFLSISSCSPLSLAPLFQSLLSLSIFLANFFILGAKCLAR